MHLLHQFLIDTCQQFETQQGSHMVHNYNSTSKVACAPKIAPWIVQCAFILRGDFGCTYTQPSLGFDIDIVLVFIPAMHAAGTGTLPSQKIDYFEKFAGNLNNLESMCLQYINFTKFQNKVTLFFIMLKSMVSKDIWMFLQFWEPSIILSLNNFIQHGQNDLGFAQQIQD